MPSNNTNSDDADASDTPSHGLIRTTGPDGFDEIDPQLQDALDDGSLTEAKISKVIAAQKQAAEKHKTQRPTIEAESPTDAKTSSSGEKESGESDTEVDVDDSPDEAESSAGMSTTTTGMPKMLTMDQRFRMRPLRMIPLMKITTNPHSKKQMPKTLVSQL